MRSKTKPVSPDLLPYALSVADGLLAPLLAPAVDRLAERFDAWVARRLT